jgi:hypothetical protein
MVNDSLLDMQASEAAEAKFLQTPHGQLVAQLRSARPVPMNETPRTEYNIMDTIPPIVGSIICRNTPSASANIDIPTSLHCTIHFPELESNSQVAKRTHIPVPYVESFNHRGACIRRPYIDPANPYEDTVHVVNFFCPKA